MTNLEILQKAEANGFTHEFSGLPVHEHIYSDSYIQFVVSESNGLIKLGTLYWFEIIFSHDFLKAYFGEEIVWYTSLGMDEKGESYSYNGPGWKHHSCQMLLSEDPVSYLATHL